MAEVSELYGESVNDTKFSELEESLISQDDYKKLKQEIEYYKQELHVTRLKLNANKAIARDLQESNDVLEKRFTRYMTMMDSSRTSAHEQYTADKQLYENRIIDLETNLIKKEDEIKELQKELKKYKENPSDESHYLTLEETLTSYKKEIAELTKLLQNEEKNVEELKHKLTNMEDTNQELCNNFRMVMEQLKEKEEALENARESVRDLAANLKELEQSKVAPASDTCKGNSLFAEVEDRRQILMDKMKVLTSKYNDAKRALNTKMIEIKLLKAEKSAVARKWEVDVIDTLQENTDLLSKYKKRIVELEYKLKMERKKNEEEQETQFTDDNFNYIQKLIIAKGKELKELNEKIEKQTMQILVQEEINHTTSRQFRYWRSKAMSLEAQIQAIKAQLETKQANDDNKTLLEAIENCTISDDVNLEEPCDSEFTPSHRLVPEHQGNSIETSKKSVMDSKELKKFVRIASDS